MLYYILFPKNSQTVAQIMFPLPRIHKVITPSCFPNTVTTNQDLHENFKMTKDFVLADWVLTFLASFFLRS